MNKIIIDDGIIESKIDLAYYDIKTESYNERIGSFLKDIERFEIQPYFQRHFVWTQKQKSKLIGDTILRGLTLPAIYTYLDFETGKEVVIDGQQRLMTIYKFSENQFVLSDLEKDTLNGYNYFSLPSEFKTRFMNYKLPIVQITNVKDRKIIFKLFENYNTGNTKLNVQELRHCVYTGKYNSLVTELSKYKPFKSLFDNKDKEVDRMEREEYVLRFLALYDCFDKYSGNMNKFLNNFMDVKLKLNDLSDEVFAQETKNVVKAFKKSVDASLEVFGISAFRNCLKFTGKDKNHQIMYKLISKPVYDMQMLGFADFDLDLIIRHKAEIKRRYEELVLNDENMRPYYKKMSRKAVQYRINEWKKEIGDIVKTP